MRMVVERFGRSYLFQVPELGDLQSNVPGIPGQTAIQHGLTAVFPELEGHHLAIMCNGPDCCPGEDAGQGSAPGAEGVDLSKI